MVITLFHGKETGLERLKVKQPITQVVRNRANATLTILIQYF